MTQNPQACQVNYVRFGGPAAGLEVRFTGRGHCGTGLNIYKGDHFFTCASGMLELYVIVYYRLEQIDQPSIRSTAQNDARWTEGGEIVEGNHSQGLRQRY
jgi:hypothetical protein